MTNNEKSKVDIDEVIVRPYPKVILLYPMALVALICGTIQALYNPVPPNFSPSKKQIQAEATQQAEFKDHKQEEVIVEKADQSVDNAPYDYLMHRMLGLIFYVVFGLNLLVFSFEFSRLKSLAIGLAVLAAVFLCLWLGEKWPIIETLSNFVKNRIFYMSTELYLGLFIYFALIFIGVFINTRFNYYEIKHNEILHHTGFLGHVQRYPSPNLKMSKEITDIFEYLLLRSGRMILFPASEKEAIVLENVINVNSVDRKVHELLSTLAVEIETPGGGDT